MQQYESTNWNVIQKSAAADKEQREEFARRYSPIVRDYLTVRWAGSTLAERCEDAEHDVFVECFSNGGVLERADPRHAGGFRPYFYGVIRNIARRHEDDHGKSRGQQLSTDLDEYDLASDETSLSQVLDRSWARSILTEADKCYRRQCEAEGGPAQLRYRLLGMRFEEGLSIREIAKRLKMDVELLHIQYRRARREFRRCLNEELDLHVDPKANREQQWLEFISLL